MTVKDIINKLKCYPEDKEVYINTIFNSGGFYTSTRLGKDDYCITSKPRFIGGKEDDECIIESEEMTYIQSEN